MQPGWYDDPFARGWLRWWDGERWTPQQMPHGMPPPPAVPTRHGVELRTPQQDLATSERWARWGIVAFVAAAVVQAVQSAVIGPIGAHWLRHEFNKCIDQLNSGATTCNQLSGTRANAIFYIASAPFLVVTLIVALWLFQTATIGRNLGLESRREPGWAFALFVPVINLWFPYQVAVGTLPWNHPRRSAVGWWWAIWLTQGIVVTPVLIVGLLISQKAAVVIGLIGTALPILVAVTGIRMVRVIRDAHRELLAAHGAMDPGP